MILEVLSICLRQRIKLMLTINTKRKLLKQIIKEQGFLKIIVSGNSMFPVILNNEAVDILKASAVRIGDIVLWTKENGTSVILHRVVCCQDGYVMTKGDNNIDFDLPIQENDIIGLHKPKRQIKNIICIIKNRKLEKKAAHILSIYLRIKKSKNT